MLSRYGPGGNLCYLGNKNAGGGSQGPIGPQGQQGIPGPAGPTGPTGPGGSGSGGVGPVGPAGPAGPTGAQGLQGIPGPVGPAGPTGASGTGGGGGVGPIGPQGPAGPTGAAGTNGTNGAAGPAGNGVSTLSIINGRLNATFTITPGTFDLGNVVGPVGPAGATGPPGTVATPAVTKIIPGRNVTISPAVGTGDVTVNSMGCYILKLNFAGATLDVSNPVIATSDPNGNSLAGWTFTRIGATSFSFRPPTGFPLLGFFHRYTQSGSSTSYLVSAFSVGNVTGAYILYDSTSNTYTFASLTTSLSGIDNSLAPGYMYITFNIITNTTLFI